jgi:tRNA(Ile)-lysidine synthase
MDRQGALATLKAAVAAFVGDHAAADERWCVALSGGADSLALTAVAAASKPTIALIVDHRLQTASSQVAATARDQAMMLGCVDAQVLCVDVGTAGGPEAAARTARYRALDHARGDAPVLLAHTLDDQAETVLFRLARGSGLMGLAAMAQVSPLPVGADMMGFLLRPLLHVPKARLVATLQAAGIGYSEDPSNLDPRFTRSRLRALMPHLAREGLSAHGLSRFAARMRRADATIEFAVAAARDALAPEPWPERGPVKFDTARFASLPAEVAVRLLGRAIARTGSEGPVELAKLESLYAAMRQTASRLRRTLAGSLITVHGDWIVIERAPARRFSSPQARSASRTAAMPKHRKRSFTK